MKWHTAFFILLCFLSTSFAQTTGPWIPTAAVAILLSTTILALLYAIGVGFGMDDLKLLSTEELYQLIVTALIIAVLFGVENSLNSVSVTVGGRSGTIQASALSVISNTLTRHATMFDSLKQFSVLVGEHSSQSLYCSWLGIGFNAAGCSSFRALAPVVTLSMQTLSVSISELSSLRTLISFAVNYSFTLLLPFGILLRTLKVTRGAGGLFIGLAAGLYLFMPLAVLFMDSLIVRPAFVPQQQNDLLAQVDCNPGDFVDTSGALNGYSYVNPDKVQGIFNTLLGDLLQSQPNRFSFIRTYLFAFLVEGTMMTIVALLTFLAAVRWISKLAGSDVDIFALARIA